ncbi:MAG: hypothetical protein NTV77_03520 [Candidatus Azambacteria bacterium]|nr:hypothetical protein [Candidatus Azambacteria bacterium]
MKIINQNFKGLKNGLFVERVRERERERERERMLLLAGVRTKGIQP